MIASGSGDKTVRVVRVIDGKIVLEDHGHSSQIASLAFSPDGMMIVSGSGDETVGWCE